MTAPTDESRRAATTTSLDEDMRRLAEGISTHAIFTLDAEGAITTWPRSAEALYGYDPTSILNEPLRVLFADEDRSNQIPADLLDDAKQGSEEVERWNERADGTFFWTTMTVSPLWNDHFRGYAVISHDTTAKKQYEQMLERQNDRLKEFTDILAHDLRNPLNIIDGHLELLRETGDTDHIDTVEETTARMERLVDDLLRVAQQGQVVTDPERLRIESVIEPAWDGTGETLVGSSLESEPVPPISGDADRLCELFGNLFRNAIEHGGDDVTVRVGPIDHGFYVEDDGPGIPADIRDEVFDHGFTTSDTGSGYGLSIVRTIVNAHGWDILATDGVSGGARFQITGIEFLS